MKAQILILVGLLMIGSGTFAKNKNNTKETEVASNAITSISGTITDEATGENLVGVKVVLEGTDKVAYTDFDGMFKFEGINKGTYKLSADYISYTEKEATIDTQSSSEVSIKLKSDN